MALNPERHQDVVAAVRARLECGLCVELDQFLRLSPDELALLITRELGFGMSLSFGDPQIPQTDGTRPFPQVGPQPVEDESTEVLLFSPGSAQGLYGALGGVNYSPETCESAVA